MSIVIPPELKDFVQEEVNSGRYQSQDQLVCEGLRLLQERQRKQEKLRRDIQDGIDQLERGEFITIDSEEAHRAFFEDIKRRGREWLESRKKAKP